MLDRFVSMLIELPLWLDAGVPSAVLFVVVSVAVISPVSFRAQPAKQISVAANNANFLIVKLLVRLCSEMAAGGDLRPRPLNLHKQILPQSPVFHNGEQVGLAASSALSSGSSESVLIGSSGAALGISPTAQLLENIWPAC
jgi:hypothetical protein